jgi:predicted homoserine dehydrogenase-like protein
VVVIIVDRLLAERAEQGRPVRVGMLGAGFMAKGIANQIVNSTPGMELVAIANRHPERAESIYAEAGIDKTVAAANATDVDAAAEAGRSCVTDDPEALTRAGSIDCLIEVTGAVEYSAKAMLDAIEHGKHIVSMNAEVDGTVGPILQVHADRAGVILTASEGDQPGVQANLYRFVKGIGLRPLLIGNIKGLHDPYRNPTTQEGFAKQWGQNVHMVTSFADGTKISFEQAIVANAFGFRVAQRAMLGIDHRGHVDELTDLYDYEQLVEWGGIVDYVVGSQPSPGVFVLADHADPKQRHYLNLYKLGEGPLYSFYIPYHLCHFEVPSTVARAVLLNDPVMQPEAGPCVDVAAVAKEPLAPGDKIDALGGYKTYGVAENYDVALAERLLPIGVAEGCKVVREVAKDQVLTYGDVEVPAGRTCDRLRAEQEAHFAD